MTKLPIAQARIARPGSVRPLILGAALIALAGCESGLDWDLRPAPLGSTADAARTATGPRPQADARGVISYPGYQVVVARRGDTVESVARRLEIDAAELASHNAITPDTGLRDGEVLALPRRVAPGTGERTDVGAIAATALDRVGGPGPSAGRPAAGPEPVRHTVLRGETAFTIARLYNVTPRALADWNGLGAEMAVREGQTLMIPVAQPDPARTAAATPPAAETPPASPPPGAGSPTPTPPSAARPLPQDDPAVAPAPAAPSSPDLGAQRTASARLAMPVDGRVIREFAPGRSDGVTFAADAGSPVRAAADGTVANITRDTSQNQFVILRHDGNLLTVYANIDDIAVERGQQVRRGQQIGAVQSGESASLIFQVREGIDSVDPMPFLR